jgi:phosphatidate cytidylyltransferase
MASSLPRRIGVAAVGIPTALVVVYFGGWLLALVLAVLALLGVREVFGLAAARGIRPLRWLGYLAAGAAPALVYRLVVGSPVSAVWLGYGVVAWLILTMAAAVAWRAPAEGPLEAIAVTLFAPVYAGLLPAFILVIRHGHLHTAAWAATWLVFTPLVVTWVCDTMAMVGGALVGGPQFAPVLSPRKTWAGTVSGSLAAVVVAPLYGWLLLEPHGIHLGVARLVLLGLVLSVVGQVGDLAESLLKREAGVKDSGTIFPGHGGVLDRLDSLYWVLPAAAGLFTLFGVL